MFEFEPLLSRRWRLVNSALSAGGKKERHRARDMWRDLGAQRCEALSEQRTHQHRRQDQLEKIGCGGGAAVGDERRQLVGFRDLAQKLSNGFDRALARHPTDAVRQIRQREDAKVRDIENVVITAIGRAEGRIRPENAAALVGAGWLRLSRSQLDAIFAAVETSLLAPAAKMAAKTAAKPAATKPKTKP